MELFSRIFILALPLFLTVGAGYSSAKIGFLSPITGDSLAKYAFNAAIPCLMFETLTGLSKLAIPDLGSVYAYFGGCLLVFCLVCFVASRSFRFPADSVTVFGMSSIFSNNVQLGIPLVLALMGQSAIAISALIVSINVFLLWLVASVMIEFYRSRTVSITATILTGIKRTLMNPVIGAIVLGLLWTLTGKELWAPIATMVRSIASTATPVALFSLGISLAQYSLKKGLAQSIFATGAKLLIHPFIVFAICRLLGVGEIETGVATLLSSLPTGVNVYIMSREFKAGEEMIANTLLLSTFFSVFTVPFFVSLLQI